MNPDLINGAFEAVGAYFTWRNAWQLHKEQTIRGVYWPAWAFWSAWGTWNLFYYPALDQWWSFGAGVLLVGGNIWWTQQAVVLWLRGKRERS